MTTLPTFAECAAVPPEKRTALERFIWANQPPNDEYPGMKAFRDQLTAVIEEERKECDALRTELKIQDDANDILTDQVATLASELRLAKSAAEYNGEMLDKVRKERDTLAAENARLYEALLQAAGIIFECRRLKLAGRERDYVYIANRYYEILGHVPEEVRLAIDDDYKEPTT